MQHRIGYGDVDFTSIIQTSGGAAAWSDVQGQLKSELGQGIWTQAEYEAQSLAAQGHFTDAYNQLNKLQVDPIKLLPAAGQFAAEATTALSAVRNAADFISMANDPTTPPQALISSFTGIIVGVAVAAGAVSAGAGAGIVAGVAIAVEVLSSNGFFPPPVQGSTIPGCNGGVHIVPGDDGVVIVGCAAGQYGSKRQAHIPSPQDPAWRAFPEPNGPGNDYLWYFTSGGGATLMPFQWGPSGYEGTWFSNQQPRMIDSAFPQFHHLECESANYLPGPPGDFQRSYFSAWKINSALKLNGQGAANDYDVLNQLVNQWNRAHESSSTYTFQPRGADNAYMPPNTDCKQYSSYGPYVAYLIGDIGGALVINTGPKKTVLNAKTGKAVTGTTSTSSPGILGTILAPTNLAKVGAYGAGGLIAAVAVYSLATNASFFTTWQKLWNRTTAETSKLRRLKIPKL